MKSRLGLMLFLEYFIWGSWYVTIGTWLSTSLHFTGQQVGIVAGATAVGAIVAPFFVGLIADKFVATEKILGILHLAGVVLLLAASRQTSFPVLYAIIFLYCLCFMPTLALTNSLCFRQMKDPKLEFGGIRVLGTAGWIVAGREACRAGRADPAAARFWGGLVLGVFLLSFTTYGDREHYGLAHIWFHSLVLLGLAFLAARWSALEPPWKRLLVFGWVLDFVLGIELQFADQDLALDRWLTPERRLNEVIASYSAVVQENFREKVLGGQPYFADLLRVPEGLVAAFLLALLVLATWRAARARSLAA